MCRVTSRALRLRLSYLSFFESMMSCRSAALTLAPFEKPS